MKKIIVLLAIVFSFTVKAQTALNEYLLTYTTIDDFFNKKFTNHGVIYRSFNLISFKCDSANTSIKYNVKDHNIFAYEFSSIPRIIAENVGEIFIGGNKSYFITSSIGSLMGNVLSFEKANDALYLITDTLFVSRKITIKCYKAAEPKKGLTLEELLQDCPMVYDQYMKAKQENKSVIDYKEYLLEQLKYFRMYIECKKN